MSKHGATEKSINILKTKVNDDDLSICNLKNTNTDLSQFDDIIIGCSIHAGRIQGKIKKFCKKNESILLKKKLAIFITCMDDDNKTKDYFKNNFSKELINHAKITALFGGEFNFEKMNFIERAIIKKITGLTKTSSKTDEQKIVEFAEQFNI